MVERKGMGQGIMRGLRHRDKKDNNNHNKREKQRDRDRDRQTETAREREREENTPCNSCISQDKTLHPVYQLTARKNRSLAVIGPPFTRQQLISSKSTEMINRAIFSRGVKQREARALSGSRDVSIPTPVCRPFVNVIAGVWI